MGWGCRTVWYGCFISMALLANFGVLRVTELTIMTTTTTKHHIPATYATTNTTTTTNTTKIGDPIRYHDQAAARKTETFKQVETSSSSSQGISGPLSSSHVEIHNPPPTNITNSEESLPTIQRTMRFGKHWRPLPDYEFKIPFPVFLASLPKSGTTSIHAYFRCGRVRSVHTYCPKNSPTDGGMERLGVLIEQNVKQGFPPFQGCGTADSHSHVRGPAKIFTDVGYVLPDGPCYYPSVSALDALYQAYPNMTIMLSTRNGASWFKSLQQWHGGYFVQRLIQYCDFVPRNDTVEAFVKFYQEHNDHVRQFAKQHPSITYVEFAIDSPTAGDYLEQATGIPRSCWGNHLPGRRTTTLVPKKPRRKKPIANS